MVAFLVGLLLMFPSAMEAYDEQNAKEAGKLRAAREIVLEEIIPNRRRGKGSRSVALSRRR